MKDLQKSMASGPGADRVKVMRRSIIYACVGVACIALVFTFGTLHFRSRAAGAIDMVKNHPVTGSADTVAEGILGFLTSRGVEVSTEGFKPSWGAEQVDDSEWIVSYVFEVGRESHRVSWRVDTETGAILPRDAHARLLTGEE